MAGSTLTVRLLGATGVLLLASACGSSTVAPHAAADPVKAIAPGTVVSVAKTALGPVMVDSLGFTVYLLTADTPGHSSCDATCLQAWPVVRAPAGGGVPSGQGVTAALTPVKATDGTSMITAGGWPLYTFIKDRAPGDVNGQGKKSFGGTWYAVSPSGEAVTTPASGAPATTSEYEDSGSAY